MISVGFFAVVLIHLIGSLSGLLFRVEGVRCRDRLWTGHLPFPLVRFADFLRDGVTHSF